jgi:hypothetical protein
MLTGWQWQGQRGRLADSPQAGTKQKEATRYLGRVTQGGKQAGKQKQAGRQWQVAQGGKQVMPGRQADEIRQRGKFW